MEIDLLADSKIKPKWVPNCFSGKKWWRTYTGKWKLESHPKKLFINEAKLKAVENISVIGYSNWKDFSLKIRFKILTASMKPPEGGVIIYFLFRDRMNFYSIHFCEFKKKFEFIKRYKGNWSTLADQNSVFELQKDYWVTISTFAGRHTCIIDENDSFTIFDDDISSGCVGVGAKYCSTEFNHLSVKLL